MLDKANIQTHADWQIALSELVAAVCSILDEVKLIQKGVGGHDELTAKTIKLLAEIELPANIDFDYYRGAIALMGILSLSSKDGDLRKVVTRVLDLADYATTKFKTSNSPPDPILH